MKKVMIVLLALFFFGCENTTTRTETNTQTREAGTRNTTSDFPESAAIGSGTEISPQLEGVEESATRLQVETITTRRTNR